MSAASPQISPASSVNTPAAPGTTTTTHPLAALIERAVVASKERASRGSPAKPAAATPSNANDTTTRAQRTPAARTDQPPDRAAERLFVSPRVVDARAFADYAASLKEVIREAGGHSRTLQSVGVEVKGIQDRVAGATKELQSKLELAARFLPTIDQRLQRAETIAGSAEKLLGDDAEALAAKIRGEMERIGRDAADAAEKRIAATVDAAIAKLLAGAEDAAARHAATLERIAQDAETKRAHIAAAHGEALNELEDRAASARTSVHELADHATAAINDRAAHVSAGLEPLLDRGTTMLATLDTRLDRVQHAAAEAKRWLTGEGIERLQNLMTLAQSLAGDPTNPDRTPGALVGLIDEARRIHDEAGKACARLESLREQTELARTILGDELAAATDKIDDVSTRAEHAKSRADEVVRVIDAADEIGVRVFELSDALNTAKTQAADVGTMLDEAITRARAGVEQAEAHTRERAAAAARESLEPIAARAAEIRETVDLRAMEVQALIDQSAEALAALDAASEKTRENAADLTAQIQERALAIANELESRATDAARVLLDLQNAGLSPADITQIGSAFAEERAERARIDALPKPTPAAKPVLTLVTPINANTAGKSSSLADFVRARTGA
jgi:hypothetical protein